MIILNTADALRASHVTRWQIVSTHRAQSVAEHTFGVITIALGYVDWVRERGDGYEYDAIFCNQLMECAFHHDLPEVVTGDFPTPIKRLAGIGDALKAVESRISYLAPVKPVYSDNVLRICKSADLIEAILYLDSCADSPHALGVLDDLKLRLSHHSDLAYRFYLQICEDQKDPMTMDKLADIMDADKLLANREVNAQMECSQCANIALKSASYECENSWCRYGMPF